MACKQFCICIFILLAVQNLDAQQVVARCGYWKSYNAAQNSLEALGAAQDLQLYGTECDVRLTSDDVALIFELNTIDKTPVEQLSVEALQQTDEYALSNGENIPTLDSYLKNYLQNTLMRGSPTKLFLDLKPHRSVDKTETLIDMVVEQIEMYQIAQRTVIISSDFYTCEQMKQRLPKVTVLYTRGDKTPNEVSYAGLSGICYSYNALSENPQWVAEARALGMEVLAWTINSAEEAKAMKELGVDAIMTDNPEEIAPALR